MIIIIIRYVLPVLALIILQCYLSFRDNKFLGLIIPVLSLVFTAILMNSAMESLGTIFAVLIMLIPNVLSIILYTSCRNVKQKQFDEIVKLKFKKK